MISLTHNCPACGGDGKETCNNPDHGFISALSFHDIGRIGCPVCGHHPSHKVPKGGKCEACNGLGRLSRSECLRILEEWNIDNDPDDYITGSGVTILLTEKTSKP